MPKLILHLNDGSSGILALRAATSLIRDGYTDCIYAYEDGTDIYVRRNKSSITAIEKDPQSGCFSASGRNESAEGYPQQEAQPAPSV